MKTLILLSVFLSQFLLVMGQPTTVLINEFCAKNTLGPVDNAGELEDWVELYNYGSDTVDVAGFYMTDKLNQPTLWQIPAGNASTRIPPLGFLLLWADEDLSQGVLHLDFKLSNDGEALGLLSPAQVWLDSLSFGVQADDVSYGRTMDGGPAWQSFLTPTPGSANNPYFLQAEPQLLSYSSNGSGPASISISSNVNWSAVANQTWISLVNPTGSGNGSLSLTVAANTNPAARTGSITISGAGVSSMSITVNQLGSTPTLVVSTTLLDLNSPAGSQAGFDILSNVSWTIACPDTWVGIVPASGADNASVVVTALTENPGQTERNAVLTVSGPGVPDRLINITQAATPLVPIVFINEILASSSTILDEYGEAEDFVELYNPGPDTVDLAGLYLSDDPSNPEKWQFPAGNDSTILPPGQWMVVWADEDGSQGVLHANFKFSASGEFIGLFVNPFYPVDSLSFPAMTVDVSRGRLPDGQGNWGLCQPTPGAANLEVNALELPRLQSAWVWPNPASNSFVVQGRGPEAFRMEIYSADGRLVLSSGNGRFGQSVDIQMLKAGVYLVVLRNQEEIRTFRLLKP